MPTSRVRQDDSDERIQALRDAAARHRHGAKRRRPSKASSEMKRAKHRSLQPPKLRNPVARSPLLGKGGAHGKTTAARRRAANVALAKEARDPKTFE